MEKGKMDGENGEEEGKRGERGRGKGNGSNSFNQITRNTANNSLHYHSVTGLFQCSFMFALSRIFEIPVFLRSLLYSIFVCTFILLCLVPIAT